ncbi:hypothetical protein K5X82_12860 [Halosquirtibacter xylanolyticus]|uniref:hypothetical protein n=1 Tax=Halosquirtibacter xylanolyticus TaxID=3374599 RepID=UPI0037496319|nr:hypothetical protein K5X82_12860 [Prolixibacteraceae bacterium]
MKTLLYRLFRHNLKPEIETAQGAFETYFPIYTSFAFDICCNKTIVKCLIEDLFIDIWFNHPNPIETWGNTSEMFMKIKVYLLTHMELSTSLYEGVRHLSYSRISPERESQLKNFISILSPLQQEILNYHESNQLINATTLRSLNLSTSEFEKEVGKILQLLHSLPNPNQKLRLSINRQSKRVGNE